MIVIIASCSSSQVCGGSGGKRCVETNIKPVFKNIS